MNKNPLWLIIFCWVFLFSSIFALEIRVSIKYSQIFADRQITITENIKLGERIFLLPAKKGFVNFEE